MSKLRVESDRTSPLQVQTLSDVRAAIQAAGVAPRKRWGQNFLIDGNLMRLLHRSAELTPDDRVLEVGPGTGGLTDLLLADAGHVIAVEVDPALCRMLTARYAGRPNFTLVQADALAAKHEVASAVLTAVGQHPPGEGGSYKLVANLPYNIATPLLVNLVMCCWQGAVGNMPGRRVERYCFTVQKEVADRIEARPSTPDYGQLSVVLQATCAIERTAAVPASAFWPRPQVASAMLRMDRRPDAFDDPTVLASFIAFVRAGFAYRRKTLRYVLTAALGAERSAALADAVDLQRRPDAVAVDEWIGLFGRTHSPPPVSPL